MRASYGNQRTNFGICLMTPQGEKAFFIYFAGFFGVLLTTVTINLALYSSTSISVKDANSEGYVLMKKYGCFTCHKLHGAGSLVGPVLDDIGTKREANWMARWIKDPYSIKRNSRMPPFFYLPDEHIRKIAEYLSQQRGDSNNQNTLP